jgi:MFS family permease
MRSTIIWVGIFLGSLAGLAYGLLSMFSPRALEKVMEWYTRADRWSKRRQTPRSGGTISQRVAGFFIALMTGWIAFHLVEGLRQVRVSAPPTTRPEVPQGGDGHWSALIVGLVTIALGIFSIVKPQVLLRMTQANFPNRELSQEMVDKTRQGGRVLGVLTIAFGAFVLFLWYRWTH